MSAITVHCIVYLCDACSAISDPIPVDEELALSWSEDQTGHHHCPHCTATQGPR